LEAFKKIRNNFKPSLGTLKGELRRSFFKLTWKFKEEFKVLKDICQEFKKKKGQELRPIRRRENI